jgi:hypothetical protein
VKVKDHLIGSHILQYESTCQGFGHLEVSNIQPQDIASIKFNVFLNLTSMIFISCMCVELFTLLNHNLASMFPSKQISSILEMVESISYLLSTPNVNLKGLILVIESLVK